MSYFGNELLPFLGIKDEIIDVLPTEDVTLIMKSSLTDYNFLTADGRILHFEFQSSNGGAADLRRFRQYEVNLSAHYGIPVITFVLFTGNIKNPMTELTEGVNTYRIIPIILKDIDSDQIIADIIAKYNECNIPSVKELIPLLLTPLMSGTSSVEERIEKAFRLLKKQESAVPFNADLQNLESILYVFASKFLHSNELDQLQEVIKMTYLGQMLYADGMTIGVEKGRLEERCQMLLELLREMGNIPGTLADTINQENSLDTLKSWTRIALHADSISEFTQQIQSGNK